MDINLLVKNEFNSRELLILVDAHKGIETLGVFMAPNENMSNELTTLNRKVSKCVNSMKRRRLLGFKTLLCINTTIIKTLEYLFLTTNFSE